MNEVDIAKPLVVHLFAGRYFSANYSKSLDIEFTAISNNSEVANVVLRCIFGINSGEEFSGVIGPLIDVPALIALVTVAFWFRKRYYLSNF